MLNLFYVLYTGLFLASYRDLIVPVHTYLIVLPHVVLYTFTFLMCETITTNDNLGAQGRTRIEKKGDDLIYRPRWDGRLSWPRHHHGD